MKITKRENDLCDRLERDMHALQITRQLISRDGMTARVHTGHNQSTWEVWETTHPDMIAERDRFIRGGAVP